MSEFANEIDMRVFDRTLAQDAAEQIKARLESLPLPEATPEEKAMDDVAKKLGQYFTPHVRQGAELYAERLQFHREQEDLDYRPAEPGDYLEEALFAWKPGAQDAQELAERAMRMAGISPPFEGLTLQGLATVAQDLIDNDPRLEERGEE